MTLGAWTGYSTFSKLTCVNLSVMFIVITVGIFNIYNFSNNSIGIYFGHVPITFIEFKAEIKTLAATMIELKSLAQAQSPKSKSKSKSSWAKAFH